MKIENNIIYIDDKVDLDHLLGDYEKEMPPSEQLLENMQGELWMHGMEDELFNEIVINNVWEEE